MNILITGGYGFVGSFVAERFYKEGHKIFILDNLSTGKEENIKFKHKFFQMDVADDKCADIFKINAIDIVVHLAAPSNIPLSMENPYEDSMSNVIGLINMLNLSHKNNVKRFIFMSTANIYGESSEMYLSEDSQANPKTNYAAGKLIGEEYCRIYNETYGLSTISLRASNIYGPRQGIKSEAGVIGEFIKKIIMYDTIYINGSGNQTRDFIYVSDVADAVYRSAESDYCGVLNLSSRTETSINEVVKLLRSLSIVIEEHAPERPTDTMRVCLDNTRIKRELDWVPMYSLKEGLEKTLEWYKVNNVENTRQNSKENQSKMQNGKLGIFAKLIIPYVENVVLFILIVLLERAFPTMGDFFFLDLKLIYIILISVAYGTKHSIIAVCLASSLFIYKGFGQGKDIISLFYDSNSLIRVAYYVFIGFFTGYSMDIKNRIIKNNTNKYETVQEKLDFLTQVYNDTKNVKDELQRQIRMSDDSLTKVYSIIKELDTLSPEKIYSSALNVLEKIMKSKSLAIYILGKNKSFARLVAKSARVSNDISKSIRIEDNEIYRTIVESRNIYINTSFTPGMPRMIAPVENSGDVLALIEIYNVEFENVNLYYQNLFMIVANFISSSLTKAILFQEATFGERYVNGTNILKKEVFNEILESKMYASENEISSFVVLQLEASNDIMEVSRVVGSVIRELDYIGIGSNNSLYVLLSNTKEDEAGFVIKRLADKGIKASMDKGEVLVA